MKGIYTFLIILIVAFVAIATVIMPDAVIAQSTAPVFDPGGILAGTGLNTDDANTTIYGLISAVLQIIGVISLVIIMYGGFVWLTSGGAPNKVDEGKRILFWGIIGLGVILSSIGIVEFLDTVL